MTDQHVEPATQDPIPPVPFSDSPIFDSDEAERRLTSLLSGEPAPKAPPAPAPSEAAPAADDAAPSEETPSGEDKAADPEPEAPPIEPPRSWSKEARDAWTSLPRNVQEYVLGRETERDAEVRRGQSEVDRARKEVASERDALAQERQKFQASLREIPPTVQAKVAELQQHPFARLSQEQRMQLVQSDPARFLALQTDYGTRQAEAQQLMAAEQQRHSDWLSEQQSKLAEAAPEFVNPETATKVKGEAVSYLRERGFNDDEIKAVQDHRFYLVLRDVIEGRAAKAELARMKDVAAKKVANVPPVAKPGTASTPQEVTHQKRTALRTQIGQARSDDDAAAILAQFL